MTNYFCCTSKTNMIMNSVLKNEMNSFTTSNHVTTRLLETIYLSMVFKEAQINSELQRRVKLLIYGDQMFLDYIHLRRCDYLKRMCMMWLQRTKIRPSQHMKNLSHSLRKKAKRVLRLNRSQTGEQVLLMKVCNRFDIALLHLNS